MGAGTHRHRRGAHYDVGRIENRQHGEAELADTPGSPSGIRTRCGISIKVLADRGLMAMQCRRLRYLENQIALKDRTIQSLRDVADAWEDVARRHGADVSDAPVRKN